VTTAALSVRKAVETKTTTAFNVIKPVKGSALASPKTPAVLKVKFTLKANASQDHPA
jgi:hypothetical protein